MPLEILPSFLFFSYISAITPGPANLCSLSTALKEGKKAALQQWVGLFTGFSIVSISSAFIAYFLGNVLNEKVKFLSFFGMAYLLYLAFHMIFETFFKTEKENRDQNDFQSQKVQNSFLKRFFTGLFIQLTNVKIMIYCLTAISSYVLPYTNKFLPLFITGLCLILTGPICNFAWLFAGVFMQRIFTKHKKIITLIMALSLVFCAVSLVAH